MRNRKRKKKKRKKGKKREQFCDRTVWKIIRWKSAQGQQIFFLLCGTISEKRVRSDSSDISTRLVAETVWRSNRVFRFPERWEKMSRFMAIWKEKEKREGERRDTGYREIGKGGIERGKKKWRKARRARVPCRWPRIARSNSSNSRNNSNKRNRINNRRI